MNHTRAYSESTYAGFERTLLARASELTEPDAADRARARRLVANLVETLAGVAVGLAVGRVVSAIGCELGAEMRAAVVHELDTNLWLPTGPRPPRLYELPDERPRSLVAELVTILRPRLCREVPGSRALISAIRDCIARLAFPQLDAFDAILARLAMDDLAAFRFGEHVQVGWQAFAAAVTGASVADASLGTPCVRETWRTWHAQAVPEPEGPREHVILRVG